MKIQSEWFIREKGLLPVPMHSSDATAYRLLKHGLFGADLIRFPPGGCVPDHIHPGAHMLFVLDGNGWVDYEGEPVELNPGFCYLIPENTWHGIRAKTELTILSVANNHRDAGSESRLTVRWKEQAHSYSESSTHAEGFRVVAGDGAGGQDPRREN